MNTIAWHWRDSSTRDEAASEAPSSRPPEQERAPIYPAPPKAVAKDVKGKRVKQPKPTTQEAIVKGCIEVGRIYSHKLSIFSGVGAYVPGLEGVVSNGCASPMSVTLTVGYFDRQGNQFGSAPEMMTVASGADFSFFHAARLYGLDQGRLSIASVIAVTAYAQ
jgi:hypothetical protein